MSIPNRPHFKPPAFFLGTGVSVALFSASLTAFSAPRAFPGAEGFGALISGGRGGSVVHVTNLNDSGAGSLRDALSGGNRIVVFDVGGLITIGSPLVVKGDNITVAGQTAPGPGITVYRDGSSVSGRTNVILRYLRFRQGIDSESGTKALNCTDGSNMIFDHLSVSWGRWDTIGITGDSSNITVQYSLMGESIDPQRFGGLIDSADRVTLSHNLWLDNQSRSPKFKANGQYINNVVYNWGANGLGGGHSGADWYQDVINNVFIKGPSSTGGFATGYAAADRVYQAGNLADLEPDGKLAGRAVVAADFQGDAPPTFEMAARHSPPVPVTLESATVAYGKVIASAGASLCRDPVDRRLLAQVASLGTKGGIVTDESAVGGQPALMTETRPSNFDTDRDGMADIWETAHGLDPENAGDGAADPDGDGYSHLETYLNELTTVPADSCGTLGAGSGGAGPSHAGGAANGGNTSGGNANGGNITGGSSNGGSANGGNTSGGSATSGSSNGGGTIGGAGASGAATAGESAAGTAQAIGGAPNTGGSANLPSAGKAPADPEPAAPTPDAGGCSCRLAPASTQNAWAWIGLAFGAACLRRRAAGSLRRGSK